jgi:hypothetical protein
MKLESLRILKGQWNENSQKKLTYPEKTCTTGTFFTINPVGLNPVSCGVKQQLSD